MILDSFNLVCMLRYYMFNQASLYNIETEIGKDISVEPLNINDIDYLHLGNRYLTSTVKDA